VVLVIEAGKTHRENVQHVVNQFSDVGVSIAGVVLNRIRPNTRQPYSYYSYGRYNTQQPANK
jgi:Mrp family chromosome partitioning ATPase